MIFGESCLEIERLAYKVYRSFRHRRTRGLTRNKIEGNILFTLV
jgi:hypothetical protein